DLARALAGLFVMGGRSGSGLRESVQPSGPGDASGALPEFNFSKDPEAAAFVMSLPVPKTLVPFDAAFPVAITAEEVLSLPVASALGPHRARLARFARKQDLLRRVLGRRPGQAAGGFHPWDVVAAAALAAPEVFGAGRSVLVRVDAAGRTFLAEAGEGDPHAVYLPGPLDVALFRGAFLSYLSRC
ncbi:MAG: nucleoside hydrolase, partial [Acidobacteria bacterium]|nr:nucleoside hydrolase [Acidobacteriota bacterium]